MDIETVYQMFPEHTDCIAYLEGLRWSGRPSCPYCTRRHSTPILNNRYHCNACNSAFSVTACTVFQRTRVPLQKWFLTISLMMVQGKKPSTRTLAAALEVDKNTANLLIRRVQDAMEEQFDLMSQIAEKIIGPEYRKKVVYSRLADRQVL